MFSWNDVLYHFSKYFAKILPKNFYAMKAFNRCEHDFGTRESPNYVESRVRTEVSRFLVRHGITKLWNLDGLGFNFGPSLDTLRGQKKLFY